MSAARDSVQQVLDSEVIEWADRLGSLAKEVRDMKRWSAIYSPITELQQAYV